MGEICGKKIIDYLLPNCFFQSTFFSIVLSVIMYPIAAENESLRIILSGVINGSITLILGLEFLRIFLKSNRKKQFMLASLPLLFVCFNYVYAVLKYGISSNLIVSLLTAILFSFQFYFVAVYILENNKTSEFIRNFDIYNIVLCFFAIIYIGRFFVSDEENLISFCGIEYMSIAYACLIAIVPFIFRIIFMNESGKKKWRFFATILLWITIVYSGTRGPILFMFFSFFLFILYSLYSKKTKQLLSIISLAILFVGILAFSVFVWSPASSGSAGRLQNIDYDREIYEQANHDNLQSNTTKSYILNADGSYSEVENIVLQEIYRNYILENNQKMVESVEELHNNSTHKGDKIFISTSENEEKFKMYNLYMGRDLLREFALKEYSKAKIFGNGPMYYINKYTNYSHNIFTDILCDFGIIGVATFCIIIFGLFILNLKSLKFNQNIALIAILTTTMCASYMISGTMYEGSFWVFLCSFAILNYLLGIEEKHEVKH